MIEADSTASDPCWQCKGTKTHLQQNAKTRAWSRVKCLRCASNQELLHVVLERLSQLEQKFATSK